MLFFWVTALLTGLTGSLHCVLMCGPLAGALPVGRLSAGRAAVARALYHTGRVGTYAALGALAGIFGQGARELVGAGYLSIGSGVLLAAATLGSGGTPRPYDHLLARLRQRAAPYLRQPRTGAFVLLGVLNGLLPCGLVAVALAGALATGGTGTGAAFGLLFGLGTVPALLAVQWGAQNLRGRLPGHWRTHLLRGMAILLVLRGLELGVPYLSPAPVPAGGTSAGAIPVCHGN
jgi:sulfite exporter TauE/SafE